MIMQNYSNIMLNVNDRTEMIKQSLGTVLIVLGIPSVTSTYTFVKLVLPLLVEIKEY